MTDLQRVQSAELFMVAVDDGRETVFTTAQTFAAACTLARAARVLFAHRSVRVLADGHAVAWG
jgi:hypothetical protein